MNRFSYNEIYVGQIESFSTQITEGMQNMFFAISGDNNPMHIDEDFACAKGFDGRLVCVPYIKSRSIL